MDQNRIIDELKTRKERPQQPRICLGVKRQTELFVDMLFEALFDAHTDLAQSWPKLESAFEELVRLTCWQEQKDCPSPWDPFTEQLPRIVDELQEDAQAILAGDPAAQSIEEIYLAYPGFYAIAIYRIAHVLHQLGFPLIPRMMTELAHSRTGVDINPGAQIGRHFFIDHATGVVIGETAVIHDRVKIFQGVTLGALVVDKNMGDRKRHPTIESDVTIYANATILGGDTVIGDSSVIGGNAWVTQSVPPNSKVFYNVSPHVKPNLP